MGVKKFLTKLVNNEDATANSKIVYSLVGVVLLVIMVLSHLFGVPVEIQIVYAVIGFILGLLGINAIPGRKE